MWEKIEKMLLVLEPMRQATKIVEQRETSIGFTVPILMLLKKKLVDDINTDLQNVRTAIYNGVEERIGKWEANDHLTLSMLLEPMFKMDLVPPTKHTKLREKAVAEALKLVIPSDTTQNTETLLPSQTLNDSNPFSEILSPQTKQEETEAESFVDTNPFAELLPSLASKSSNTASPMQQIIEAVSSSGQTLLNCCFRKLSITSRSQPRNTFRRPMTFGTTWATEPGGPT